MLFSSMQDERPASTRHARARGAREDAMEVLSYSEASLARLQPLLTWLLADILTVANLVQIPAVALTGVVAWLVSRPLCRRINAWIAEVANVHQHLEWAA